MFVKILLVVILCGIRFEKSQAGEANFEGLSSLLDTTKFFLHWKSSNEKINQLLSDDKSNIMKQYNESAQKRKTLESKFIALRDLYDEKNWKNYGYGRRAKRQAKQNSGRPVYDSLLTRRTFIPSLRTILIELSLMTLSVVVLNAFENAMAQTKKTGVPNRHRRHVNNVNYEFYGLRSNQHS